MHYNPSSIEPKWQKYWDEHQSFKTDFDPSKPKFYALDMFPYPSGAGLHVGHPEGYTATDIISRYKRMNGFCVLHPMGFDAFGLPAENYALKTGVHPKVTTQKNIQTFREQLKRLGFFYDWDREVDTTDPLYYRWTQWIFIQFYKKGLAYQSETPVNWCPQLRAVLANEEVEKGLSVEGGHPVVRKNMRQWVLRITAYADRLLDDLEGLEWPDSIKEMQRNWIGRSEGAEIDFNIQGIDKKIRVFTTRPDTLFGATFLVLAPEHPLVDEVTSADQLRAVQEYRQQSAMKSDLDRTDLAKDKNGVFIGAYGVHPFSGKALPIWIADYVLGHYGTGALMSVPAHDERDHEFALRYDLPIVQVVEASELPFTGDGVHFQSDFLNGLDNETAKRKMCEELKKKSAGESKITYRLRDWIFSRQRYWGEPIPVIHFEDGSMRCLDEDELPLLLPEVERYEPSGTGESPLATIHQWVNIKDPKTGKLGKRETNTMPQWAGSCWYYLRYTDPKNDKAPWDPAKEKFFLPVDLYVGGVEHAVLHLLYSRFWHKVLYDLKLVSTKEPFKKLVNQGLILGEDGEKMSKSRGNVVNPDDIVANYGADSFRMYEMFMGPLEKSKPWSTANIDGIFRFLNRIWRNFVHESKLVTRDPTEKEQRSIHATIKKVSEDIENLRFNTAISQLMICHNEISEQETISKEIAEKFILILSPFAPHLTEEIWTYFGHPPGTLNVSWPKSEPKYLLVDEVSYVVQVNGKLRGNITASVTAPQEEVQDLALRDPNVAKFVKGEMKKVIFVPKRLINFVVVGESS